MTRKTPPRLPSSRTAPARPATLAEATRAALDVFRAWWSPPDNREETAADSHRSHDEAAMAEYMDNLPGGIFSADADGRVLYVNRTLADWLGRPAREIVGRPFADFVIEATPFAEADTPDTPETADGGAVVLARADGGTFPATLVQTVRAGTDGRVLYTRSLVIKNFGRAAVAAAPPGALPPRWLFADAPVGIALLDHSGVIVDCNEAFLALAGVARETALGRPF
ncbi:MAG: PAS domain-containing protein, partial [Pseudomonadota bacterium]